MTLTEDQQAALGRDHLRRAAAQGVDSCAALERYILALEARIDQLEGQLVARAPWDRPESEHTTRTSDDVLFLDGQPVEYHYTTTPPPAEKPRKPILVRIPWSDDWRYPSTTLGG